MFFTEVSETNVRYQPKLDVSYGSIEFYGANKGIQGEFTGSTLK